MPDLEHTLQGHDLGFLKIVAGAWGIELNAPDTVTALPILTAGVLENADFAEVIEALPEDAKQVLQALLQNEGRMLWAAFVRAFGELRRMGMAKRDRERPDLKPASAVEVLWYRGLVGRAFLSMPPADEPQEYAYIPEDLLPLLPTLRTAGRPPLGRPATPNESAHPILANDRILDDACTFLAALRVKMDDEALAALPLGGIPAKVMKRLLRAMHLLDGDDVPHPERTREFLEAPRGKALAQMAQGWMEGTEFNELRLLPGLKFEGDWTNDSLHSRQAILEMVSQIPENRWWSLPAFVAAVREQHPDFQRPAGDYDSWFIRQEGPGGEKMSGSAENLEGSYLRGFSSWDLVDGALVRFIISGPMHWLGLLDLAGSEEAPHEAAPFGAAPSGTRPHHPHTFSALRLSRWAGALWHGNAPEGLPKENAPIKVTSDGRLTLAPLTPRPVRYQVARFCQWDGEKGHGAQVTYHYRVTPAALERAKSQGLRASQLVSLLRRHCEGPLPPTLIQALERWENSGTQSLIEPAVLLRVTAPEILAALRKTRAARCLGEALNDTVVMIRPGMEEQVLSSLAEIGYLADAKIHTAKPADARTAGVKIAPENSIEKE